MAIQNAVSAEVIVCPEGTFGTAPATGSVTARKLRRVSTSLALGKDIFQSAEARSDQQIADMRHGTKRPGGGIEGELCTVAYDDLLEGLLRGTWATGTTTLAATYTTIAAANLTGAVGDPGSTGTLIWAAGDPIAAGFRIGDVVRLVGGGFGANVGVNFRILSFSAASNRTITVTPSPAAVAANAGTSIGVVGKKLLCGTTRRSFTIEQSFPDVDVSDLFTGMRVGSGAVRVPPNGMATVSFGFMGQNMTEQTAANSPYFSAPVAIGTEGIFAGPNGALRLNGVEQAIVTAADINIDLGLSADPVVGRVTVPEIFYGPTQVGGSVSAFLQDETLINAFVNETEVDLVIMLTAAMTAPQDFLCFNMQRVKLGGATKTVAAQGGVIVTYPFTALLVAGAAGTTGKDVSTLVIQRSN
jgi:hypothetical protein